MTEPDSTNDEDGLLRRFRDGEHAAFRSVVERYAEAMAGRVRRRLPRRLRRRLTVQDVVQEACIAAHASRERFRGDDAEGLRRWLMGILENKIKETLRHHGGAARRDIGREVTRDRRPATAGAHHPEQTPSALVERREQREQVRQALEALPPAYREILRLTREEHLTVREAGERMGRSLAAAKKLNARALGRLREIMLRQRGELHGL